MAQDAHHALEDSHHAHEVGPVSHTEVVPQNSPEDSLLLLVLAVCFIWLTITMSDWSNLKAVPHEDGAAFHGQDSGHRMRIEGNVPPAPSGGGH
jgi:hypothetical protein